MPMHGWTQDSFSHGPRPTEIQVGTSPRSGELDPRMLSPGVMTMDENRIAGTVRNAGGKVEEGLGRVTGDTKTRTEGLVNQAAGAAQDLYGQARDGAADAAGGARDTAAPPCKGVSRSHR